MHPFRSLEKTPLARGPGLHSTVHGQSPRKVQKPEAFLRKRATAISALLRESAATKNMEKRFLKKQSWSSFTADA
jgi:hypothetical protein